MDLSEIGINNAIYSTAITVGKKGWRASKRVVERLLALNAKNFKVLKGAGKGISYGAIGFEVIGNGVQNYENGNYDRIVLDAGVDVLFAGGGIYAANATAGLAAGPLGVLFAVGATGVYVFFTEVVEINGKSVKEHTKDFIVDIIKQSPPPITIPVLPFGR